jgi:LemA family protein
MNQKIEKLEEIMSLLILVLSLLLIIEILGIKVVQNRKYVALKVSNNDFVVSVNDREVMTNFTGK